MGQHAKAKNVEPALCEYVRRKLPKLNKNPYYSIEYVLILLKYKVEHTMQCRVLCFIFMLCRRQLPYDVRNLLLSMIFYHLIDNSTHRKNRQNKFYHLKQSQHLELFKDDRKATECLAAIIKPKTKFNPFYRLFFHKL